ncbi:helix-turn-helix transcriptional regulator [Acidovorax kalamii]|uniref:helix-turn-helix transcriptional regulator n=1 Tax=Acidovorax kalamii TaxID=2004485 RepID=UPI0020902DE4|nr:AlpA family phage regulatory protein [Acidovorax kalamii]MCO5354078.1 AlpA family phage regulatory protein [Acidovorax kalamii]
MTDHPHTQENRKQVAIHGKEDVACALSAGRSTYVRLDELLKMVPFSASTVWRKSKDGSFVKATRLSARITAWNRQAVLLWLENKEVAR